VLRKAFRDAVIVDELIGSNPVERAKRPRARAHKPGTVWTIAQLRAFLATAQQHRLFAFFHVVAARLGHSDPAITLRVYAHVIRSAEAAAAEISPMRSRWPVSKSVGKKDPSKIGKGL
jgi:hypothetical protein